MNLAEQIGGSPLVKRSSKLRELNLLFFPSMFGNDPAERAKILDPTRIVLGFMLEFKQAHLEIGVLPVELLRLFRAMRILVTWNSIVARRMSAELSVSAMRSSNASSFW